MKILGVIPARGGSKGVPCKNIRLVAGKPLIVHAIECAQKSQKIDQFIVSTDHPEIANIAKKAGAEVPFLRPAHLAQDDTPMMPVLQHAMSACDHYFNQHFDGLLLIDPTGPLRLPTDLDYVASLLHLEQAEAIVSATPSKRHPSFNQVKVDETYASLCLPLNPAPIRRQGVPAYPRFYDLNTVVWGYLRSAIERGERLPSKTIVYEVPENRSVDLDHELDFEWLEFLLMKSQGHT